MDHRLEFEEASNETTMISELLKSAEAMQSTHSVTCGPSAKNDLLEQAQTHQKIINVVGNQTSTTIDRDENDLLTSNQEVHVLDDSSKLSHIRHVNIPYILNGELYQIQKQEGENVTVKCCHCPPDRVYRGSVRSTGNFHMHIKRRHPDLLEKLHNMKVNALLERRDRLMRNRKVSSRNNHRNRQDGLGISSFITQAEPVAPVGEFKDEANLNVSHSLEDLLPMSSSPSDLGLLHTHKLKIKEVFERHQLQKKEAAEMRNWDNSHDSDIDEPINYSINSQEKSKEPSPELTPLLPEQKPQNNLNAEHQKNAGEFANSTCRQLLPNSKIISKENVEESQQCSLRDISTTSSQSSISSSILSNFTHQFKSTPYSSNTMENVTVHNKYLREQNALTVIKPEQLMVSGDEEQHAIDLTMGTDSGIFTSESANNTPHNNINGNNTNAQRAGSQHMFTPQTSGRCEGRDVCKWQDLLHHVETSLRDIQHEMNVHNQIESNRILLDIAKFKFLHPGFQFNW